MEKIKTRGMWPAFWVCFCLICFGHFKDQISVDSFKKSFIMNLCERIVFFHLSIKSFLLNSSLVSGMLHVACYLHVATSWQLHLMYLHFTFKIWPYMHRNVTLSKSQHGVYIHRQILEGQVGKELHSEFWLIRMQGTEYGMYFYTAWWDNNFVCPHLCSINFFHKMIETQKYILNQYVSRWQKRKRFRCLTLIISYKDSTIS